MSQLLQGNRLQYDIRILKTYISFVKQANKNSKYGFKVGVDKKQTTTERPMKAPQVCVICLCPSVHRPFFLHFHAYPLGSFSWFYFSFGCRAGCDVSGSLSFCLKISSFHFHSLKDTFAGVEFWMTVIFFKHFEGIILLSSDFSFHSACPSILELGPSNPCCLQTAICLTPKPF